MAMCTLPPPGTSMMHRCGYRRRAPPGSPASLHGSMLTSVPSTACSSRSCARGAGGCLTGVHGAAGAGSLVHADVSKSSPRAIVSVRMWKSCISLRVGSAQFCRNSFQHGLAARIDAVGARPVRDHVGEAELAGPADGVLEHVHAAQRVHHAVEVHEPVDVRVRARYLGEPLGALGDAPPPAVVVVGLAAGGHPRL